MDNILWLLPEIDLTEEGAEAFYKLCTIDMRSATPREILCILGIEWSQYHSEMIIRSEDAGDDNFLPNKKTPLHYAASIGHTEAVKILLLC